MRARQLLWTGLGAAGAVTMVGGAWMLSLPPAGPHATPAAVPEQESGAMLAALKPSSSRRPVIATVGINDATEATDYLMPYGVLRRADVADVVLLATRPGPVRLFPALTVEPHATIADFDERNPAGADYVIVPAMSRDDDPAVLTWLRSQSRKGARIIGVCAGAKVVAAAGLLDGRRATTHWYYRGELLARHPTIHYVPDRRIVVDAGVVTTTGISASMPLALTLIEAMAGREKARAVADDVGVAHWDAAHDSARFRFTRPFAATAIRNGLAFWSRTEFGIGLSPGIDEVSLALVADAWSRTYRSRAVTFAPTAGARESRNRVRIIPDRVTPTWPAATQLPAVNHQPGRALDEALDGIRTRYGRRTTNFVAMQLEYPMDGNGTDREQSHAAARPASMPWAVR